MKFRKRGDRGTGGMQDRRLILMVGVYDTLDIFTYELKNAFEKMGYETLVYDNRETGKSLAALAQFVQKPVTAVLTFNNLGFNMELVEGKNVWEELGIPCVNILMDHPFCYKRALDNAPWGAVVLCTDRNHMRYLNRFYPNIAVTGFLPHAGKPLPGTKKKFCERPADIIYAGGLSRAFVDRVTPDLSGYSGLFDVEKFCRDVYENVIKHPEKTTEQGIEEELLAREIKVSDRELCQIIADFHFLDLLIVSHYREKVVAAVAKAGLSLDLYGSGWEGCDWINLPNVNFHGRVSADEVVERMQETKIVLSTMTWFKDGTHDRVFNGMLQGAVAVTDSSVYMKEAFCSEINIDDEKLNKSDIKAELVMFELNEIDALPDKIKYLLDNPDVAQRIADNGYERAMRSETWESRAKELDRDLFGGLA
jgi:glycosyltransferase involved in cell wall biosynthesis